MGSFTKGLNILQLTRFYTAQKKVPFVDDVSNSSLPFSKNTVIDPLGYEVSKYGLVKDHHFGFNIKHFMYYDHSGNILYMHNHAVIRRYKHTGYTATDTISIPGLRVFFKSADLYAAFTTELKQCYLYIFQNESLKKIQDTFRFTGFINSLLKHNNDEIFIGCSNGLYMVSLQKRKVIPILKGINVKNVFMTGDGQLWMTTNKDGFYMIK